MAEQAQLIRGGKLRPLAMLHPKSFTLASYGSIPSAFDKFPALSTHLPLSQAIGFAINNNAPDAVKEKLGLAFEEAMRSDVVIKWAKQNHYQLSGKHSQAARDEFAQLESFFAWTLQDLGANKHSPEKFDIPKP
jgi:tripartite-type tricarboxylate transporter receptor subunit TctC